jgi:hypothetical protein
MEDTFYVEIMHQQQGSISESEVGVLLFEMSTFLFIYLIMTLVRIPLLGGTHFQISFERGGILHMELYGI